ncbi:Wzy polymerase domain-containing protein [Uruburuella testudinis]|uniref:Wzy polymerase domain-containing protein n=1 Tax=Uruburuella testudinis TaxID=1282863 RepID=A0ABY4DUH2_9NEIS|nr:Wzy polymerase domain-containing protein [Uruburuella testudinis]UOO82508.1 Wzy polymerase domain-containing protein [Uruburuella testudinis]
MFSRAHILPAVPDGRDTVWDWRLWPLWFCFALIGVVPFLSLYRVGPLSSFYLEAGSLLGAVLLLLLSAIEGRLNVKLPAVSLYLLVLAVFWWMQARVMGLVFPGMSDMAVWAFIILALAAWACRGWVAAFGQDRVAAVFAWALVIGASLQAVVALMQFTGWAGADFLRGIIAYRGLREVSGQLGQRNHLGHYLMWGVLAAAYLWSQRRLPGWLGVLLVSALAAALGLVNSRTIFTYVAGVALWLPFWRWHAGRAGGRVVWIMAFALLAVAVVQLAMGPVLSWLAGVEYDTALARVEGSSFAMSARDIEWRKAWQAFLAAPLWGYGWGGYALQGFLLNISPQGYNSNHLNVLFTHAHNIVLQLLVEVGLIGTLLVAGGFVAAIWRMLRQPANEASLLLPAMMTVSLCHSMLEYPLWYIYFLTPFVLMMSLSPAREGDAAGRVYARWQNRSGVVLALLLMAGIARLGWVYHDLTGFDRQLKSDTAGEAAAKVAGLRKIAATEPMLRYYALLSLTRRIDPAAASVYPWADAAAEEALVFRPYANAYQVGLYRYRRGDRQAAEAWMRQVYAYYPYMLPFYSGKIRSNSALSGLQPDLDTACTAFRKIDGSAKPCR